LRTRFICIATAFAVAATANAQDVVATTGESKQKPAKPTAAATPKVASSSNIPTTVFSNVPGYLTAAVPGLPGFEFEPGTASNHFDRPFVHPNGNWVLGAFTNDPSANNDEIILVNGLPVVKEGDAAPWDPANVMGPPDTRLGINGVGEFAFSMNLAPTTVNDDYVIRGSGSGFTVIAQEGSPMASIPGATYDDTVDSVVILDNGVVGLQADGVDGGGVTTTTDELLELGALLIAQELVTIPGGQAGGASEFADNMDFEDFWASPNGASILWKGDLTGSTTTDQVVVLNNSVVLQEGVVIPGSGFTNPIDSTGIVEVHVDGGGNWYARGNNDIDEIDWVVRNSVVIASVGTPVTTGSSELWDDTDFSDCFFAHTGDTLGNYVVAGVTDNESTRNGVVVLNGTQVLVREGDPIDLDNDGQFDDGVYFSTFGNDDFILDDSGVLRFTATFRNGAGTTTGQGFFSANIAPCNGGLIEEYGVACAGTNPVPPRLAALGCATSGGNFALAITEGIPNSTVLLFLGIAPLSAGLPGPCTLLVNPLIQLPLPLDAAGSLTIQTVLPATSPVTLYAQALNIDPGVFWGFSASNGVSISIQ
jgi:hypothetical protein